jgi:hypothetical protein
VLDEEEEEEELRLEMTPITPLMLFEPSSHEVSTQFQTVMSFSDVDQQVEE